MMKLRLLLGLLILLGLLGAPMHGAGAQQPVVYAVLFYSPSCGHCHYVITEILPPLQEEYGEQLQMLYVDVSQSAGSAFFYAAFDTFDVPEDQRGFVPTLVIGSTVLVGSGDIPAQLPGLIHEGVVAGGLAIPPIPGLREAYEASLSSQPEADTQQENPPEQAATISTTYEETTWQDRLSQDPLGNGLAVGVLSILAIGLVVQVRHGTHLLALDVHRAGLGRMGRLFSLGLALATAAIAGTLALEVGRLALPTVLAAGVTFGLLCVIYGIGYAAYQSEEGGYRLPDWLLPLIIALGLVVAGYLAYVEINGDEAVCGAVGDCNTVQQSEYAKVFGLLPIGLLGVVGYALILAAWFVRRRASDWLADAAQALLLGFVLFGTLFSIYLTFLEPFVIGATCAWCLTSAMLMILILSLEAPAGWAAINRWSTKVAQEQPRRSQRDW